MTFSKQIFFVLLMLLNLVLAKELRIGISKSIPPYVIKETNQGIEMDILKKCFEINGYEIVPVYLPFKRTFLDLEERKLDGVLNIKEGVIDNIFYSNDVIVFENVAVSLKEKEYPINLSLEFLSDKEIIAFQNAKTLLGNEFQKIADANPNYHEYADQLLQVNRLFLNRVDFIILEKRIFQYLRHQAELQLGDRVYKEVQYYKLFKPTVYKFAFKDEKVRDDFNEGLQLIRKNGLYDKILLKYDFDF